MKIYISIFLSLILMFSGSWLYWQSRVDLSDFLKNESNSKELYRAQSHFNVILAATQRDLYPDYDALQDAWSRFEVAYLEYYTHLKIGYSDKPSLFHDKLKILNSLFEERSELLIDTLETNSILRNSEAYLLNLVLKNGDKNPALDTQIRTELVQFVADNRVNVDVVLQKLKRVISLSQDDSSNTEHLLHSLYQHVEVISQFRQVWNDIENNLTNIKLMRAFDHIARINYQYYVDIQQQAHRYQLLAYLVTVVFFIILILTIIQLKGAYHSLIFGNRALLSSEKKLTGILNLVSGGLISLDAEHDIIMFNRRAEEMFGYQRDEVMGKNIRILMPERYHGNHGQLIDDFAHSDRDMLPHMGRGEDIFGLKKDGTEFQITIGISKAHLDGSLVFTAFIEDISTQKEKEGELLYLRGLLGNVINSMPSLLVGVNVSGQIILWNKLAADESGVGEEEAMGRSLFDVYPQLPVSMRLIHEAISQDSPTVMQKVKSRKDDRDVYYDITVYPLIINNGSGAVIRVDDISEKVHIQEMMVQSEKILSVGGLAAGMAHEINNPLAGILQNMQVISNRLSKKLPKNEIVAQQCGTSVDSIENYIDKRGVLKMMDAVTNSAQRAANIVSNMLAFSRKGSGQKTPCNIVDLLDSTLELVAHDFSVQGQYDFKHIKIEKDYEGGSLITSCEQEQIQQVLLNILTNGAQIMLSDKNRKTPPCIMLRAKIENDFLCVEIEDNGPGMDEDTRKRIFEPFFTTKKDGSGTGLGLSVSFFIIAENHQGSLAVESTPGKGSKFIIQLPVNHNG